MTEISLKPVLQDQCTENDMSEEYEKFLKLFDNGTRLAFEYYQFPLLYRNAGVEVLNNTCQIQ